MKDLVAYFKSIDKIWRAIWTIIFIGFITLDLFAPGFFGVTLLKLLGVAICVVFVIANYRKDHPLLAACSLTFFSDLLLAANNVSIFGVFTFILAQFLHFARLNGLSNKKVLIFILVISTYFVFATMAGKYTIFLLGVLYAAFLISNLLLAFRWHSDRPKSTHALCAFFGFVLFFCCDFCVAGSFFSAIGVLPLFLKRIFDFTAWAFYFPSQVLLANSSKKLSKPAKL